MMAAHDEFALKQNNPCFIGLGSVGASQPSHFDTSRHSNGGDTRRLFFQQETAAPKAHISEFTGAGMPPARMNEPLMESRSWQI